MSEGLRADLTGAAVLTGIFLGLLACAELWRRFGHPKPEWTRKLVHLGGGVACLFFPFLIESRWLVLALALAMTGLFALAARVGFLRSLHGVGRASRGAEYYPLAIFLVLLLAGDRLWLYLAAVLVLAVGDAFAALVGSHYGVIHYGVEDDSKTLEGSLVFFVIAFLAIHLPMLLMTDLPRPVCVLAAVLVAILVTGFEAISLKGADNLFVPLAVVAILGRITTKPLAEVVYQNLSLVGICLGIALLVWRLPYFNVGSTMAIILYAYGNWSLASWYWALPVFGGLAVYLLAWLAAEPQFAPHIRVRAVSRALLVPFLILMVANSGRYFGHLMGAYLAASMAVLSISLTEPLCRLHLPERWPKHWPDRWPRAWRAALAAVAGCVAAGLPAWLLQPAVPVSALAAIAALVWAATYVNFCRECEIGGAPVAGWTAARFVLSLAVAAGVVALEQIGLLPPWEPL